MNGTLTRLHKHCRATTRAGAPCKSTGVGPDGYCNAHRIAAGLREKPEGFGGAQANSGRPRKPRPDQVVLDILRERAAEIIGVQIGLMRAEYPPDVRLRASQGLADRLWGRARQAVDITGEVDHTVSAVGRSVVEDPEMRRIAGELAARLVVIDSDTG